MAETLVLHLIITVPLILFHLVSSSTSNPTGFSLKIIPRDSPQSPLYPGNLTELQRIQRLINFTKARTQYLKHSTTTTASNFSSPEEPENIRMPMFRQSFYYIVETVLGNPSTVVFLLMDTGGGLVWTQCLPCNNCFRQTSAFYDSRASTSYWKLPCSHFLCDGSTQAPYQCINGECVYSVSYGGGGGPTKGVASVETFRFSTSNNGTQAIDGIVFGCSNDNSNFRQFENTVISGIMGLSWAPDSLVTQLVDYADRRFSYCLIPFTQALMAPTLITFGDEIPTPSTNLYTTRFVVPPNNPVTGKRNYYFYLVLNDISVGRNRIGFPADSFTINPDGSGGFFIDSGALIPSLSGQPLPNGRIPYRAVMGAFQRYYDSLNLKRKGAVPQGFQLCYEQPHDFKSFPPMTYHFEGADYVVDGYYVNYYNTEEGYFCVALINNGNGVSVLGAWHQQDKRLIYNGNVGGLQFAREICR